jgi:hypothetical protein
MASGRALVDSAVVVRGTDFLVELAGLATTAFFERGVFLFDADFFADEGLVCAETLPGVFFLEVLFLLDALAGFAVFLRAAEPVFLVAAFLDGRFATGRFATFLRLDKPEPLTVFFREDPPAAFLLLGLFFFLAAACFAGITLASKRDYKKPAIIHAASRSGSPDFAPHWAPHSCLARARFVPRSRPILRRGEVRDDAGTGVKGAG